MSKLEELIEELCPNGVERKFLWEITVWDKKFNAVDRSKQQKVINYPYLLAAELFALEKENGNVFLLSTGEKTGWTTEELASDNLCEGEVVTIPWGKSRPVKDVIKYYKGKFVTADNRIATSANKTMLSTKYLYYWLLSQSEVIDTFYRGSGIKHPSMKDVLGLQIPLPPLEVQSEIVRILDNFTELTAELTAELAARKKQYEYYRDSLLIFGEEVEWKALGEVGDVTKLAGFEFTEHVKYSDEGTIIALRGLNIKNGKLELSQVKYIDDSNFAKLNRSKLLINDMMFTYVGTVGQVALIDKNDKYYLAPNVARIRFQEKKVNPIFMKYYFQTNRFIEKQINRYMESSSMKNLTMEKIRKFSIPLPSLDEQQRIVDILDRFDTLCNDISKGLPAEIEARKKQYEYYRDKLLTFKEMK